MELPQVCGSDLTHAAWIRLPENAMNIKLGRLHRRLDQACNECRLRAEMQVDRRHRDRRTPGHRFHGCGLIARIREEPLGWQPKFLIHDRDADYGGDFDERLANLGIRGVRTPPGAPKANAIGERIVRTMRSECLDHLIVINERHPRVVLAEFAHSYNHDRPHRRLRLQSPTVTPTLPRGRVVARSVLGGLHHVYARAA
jgi:transposase InsO family protein